MMAGNKQNYKPFVKWVWWKRQLLEQFQEFYPESFNEYYEPFVWWWAVFFDLRNKFWTTFKAHLFDINEELVVTYNAIKDDTDDLIKLLSNFQEKNSKDFFIDIRAWDREEDFKNKRSNVERAARFIYLNRTCFNWVYRVNWSWYFNVPYGKQTNPKICDKEWLYNTKEALKNTTIQVMDFEESTKKTKAWDFVYFDPPYDPLNKTSNFTDYIKWGFWDEEQKRLAECFKRLDKKWCYVMASNNNTEFINEIYNWLSSQLVSAKRMINSDATKRWAINEIVIFWNTLKLYISNK